MTTAGLQLFDITARTLRVGVEATVIAAVIGLPMATAIAFSRSRSASFLGAVANAGLALPPIAVGQLLWLLMWPDSRWGGGPLAGLGWLYTLDAVVLAQTLLALPVFVSISAAALRSLPRDLLQQARALGARSPRLAALALREARAGIVTALIAAFGTTVATVGAILVVGTSLGNATLATATVTTWAGGGHDSDAVTYGTVLVVIFGILAAAMTTVQKGGPRWPMRRPS